METLPGRLCGAFGQIRSSVPFWQYAAIAVLSLLAVYTITIGAARLPHLARLRLTAGMGAGLLVLIAWSLALQAAWISGDARGQGLPVGWDGWILLGGSSSVVHLLMLVALVSFIVELGRRRALAAAQASTNEPLVAGK